jgi:hypothetical protein
MARYNLTKDEFNQVYATPILPADIIRTIQADPAELMNVMLDNAEILAEPAAHGSWGAAQNMIDSAYAALANFN